MEKLTQLIKNDMCPALGVTEPGAIAFLMASCRARLRGAIVSAELSLNSGMYKNAFSCGIPNSSYTGNYYAAALGLAAGSAEKGLECLADITPADNEAAAALVESGRLTVRLDHIGSRIYLRALVRSERDECEAIIEDTHTNLCYVKLNGEVLIDTRRPAASTQKAESAPIHDYTLRELVDYAERVPAEEIAFMREAYDVNLALLREGLASPRTTFGPRLLARNGGELISGDERATAQLLCNGAIEARVIGLNKPAMSITGSGAHGIICTMPLYGYCRIHTLDEEKLLRATAISYLVTQYIKEYSGRLSAFCGCGIAAGTGMACALTWLKGGGTAAITLTIRNMAAGITGMICDGGNQGCVMKGIVATDAAFSAAEMALCGIAVESVHGICAATPEATMRNMGRIASPGMVKTEEEIVHIMEEK